MGMTLADGRTCMQTIPGATMTAPWYLDHYGATAKASAGYMKGVTAVVAGKIVAGLEGIWTSIHRRPADGRLRAVQEVARILNQTVCSNGDYKRNLREHDTCSNSILRPKTIKS
jgi:hypothetical protein